MARASGQAPVRAPVRRVVSTPLAGPYASASPRLNLYTLIAIRWVAIAGQASAIAIVSSLGFKFPVSLAMSVVLISALLNMGLMAAPKLRHGRSNAWIEERSSALVLGFDLVQLALLLALTGGITNPFAVLMLAPVTVSATALSRQATIGLALVAVLLTVGFTLASLPLPTQGDAIIVPDFLRFGVLLAITIGIAFFGFYLSNISEQSRTMASALSAVQLALEREQRLAAIGGLAANAAHELGTPLATIAVIAKEMSKELEPGSDLKEDADALVEEAARCREILTEISRSKKLDDGESYNVLTLEAMIEEALGRHESLYDCPVSIALAPDQGLDQSNQPRIERRPEFVQGLGNIIQNALQHADQQVWVTAHWTMDLVRIEVADDGPGFDQELLYKLGDPYLKGDVSKRRGGSSMGIGVFIATTLLNHCGATVSFSNRRQGGACVEVSLEPTIKPNDRTGT